MLEQGEFYLALVVLFAIYIVREMWFDAKLLDILEETDRTLSFARIERNTIGSYKGAFKKPTTYVIFTISPPLEPDDVSYTDPDAQAFASQEFQSLQVPIVQIEETSESLKLPQINPFLSAVVTIGLALASGS